MTDLLLHGFFCAFRPLICRSPNNFLRICLENIKKCVLFLFRNKRYIVIVEANRQAVSFIKVNLLCKLTLRDPLRGLG